MKILSLGMGVQSTALYYMASMGELPPFDHAIFVDLGKEKKETYEYLDYLISWQAHNNGLPIHVVRKKNLFVDLLSQQNSRGKRFSSIPAFTKNEDGSTGMLLRQCTGEYKIAQVDRYVREAFYQLAPRKRMIATEIWKGISLDEVERLKLPKEVWKTQVYPFCNYTTHGSSALRITWGLLMTRNDIINWYIARDLPIPPKSSCVFCPYTSEQAWAAMKRDSPEDFQAAVLVDHAIRDSSKKGISAPIYLHESCQPLDQVVFNEDATDLWAGDCSGECHT